MAHHHRHPRLIQWQGAVSDAAAETARGIVAGCGAAVAMLRAVLIPTLDEFSRALRVNGFEGLC